MVEELRALPGGAFTLRGGALGVLPFAWLSTDRLRQKRHVSVPCYAFYLRRVSRHGKMASKNLLTTYLIPGHVEETMCLIFLNSNMQSITKIIKPPWPTHLLSKNGALRKASLPNTEVQMFPSPSSLQVLRSSISKT